MDQLYRGVETSLLVLSLALVLAVTAIPSFSPRAALEVTLPMISVSTSDAP
ncbi:hypothetical protein [Methylorubrum suomiense]|uniref:Uncharacterized protein n=1 Tax=Methylorubrum suomiense TaxID=144191 RepID=A0ABQ4USN6_9HYPH|nr:MULTISPECIES: hypothetical protein [Methylobacteriaceae]GJE75251.1 hypothetical protein BGCPKDLD_1833 [Methylorubrum suomiense]